MVNGIFQPPTPHNEPVKGYLRGSPERIELETELARQMGEVIEIPCIIDFLFTGKVHSGKNMPMVVRHDLFNDVVGPNFFSVNDARNFDDFRHLSGKFSLKFDTF